MKPSCKEYVVFLHHQKIFMKYPLLFVRIFLTIVMTLVIGLFPHHHHHGELCWALELDEVHQHEGENHTKDCPSDPCNHSTCYLQSLKTFLQTERSYNDNLVFLTAILPEYFQVNPSFYIYHNSKITDIGCQLLSSFIETESRRGPPMC